MAEVDSEKEQKIEYFDEEANRPFASYAMGARRNGDIFDKWPTSDLQKLQDHWLKQVELEFPHFDSKLKGFKDKWRQSEVFHDCLDALVDYLRVVKRADRPTMLPSKAADSVWHAWIERDPEGYKTFCQEHLGRVIEHVPNAQLKEPLSRQEFDDRLSATWAGLYRLAGSQPSVLSLPPLFYLDRHVGMPEGWAYHTAEGHIHHKDMTIAGKATGAPHHHPDVHPVRMEEIGLITAEELKKTFLPRKNRADAFLCMILGKTLSTENERKLDWVRGRRRKPTNSGGGCGGTSDGGGCGGGCS